MNSNQSKNNPENIPPIAQLFNIATGFMKSQAIYAAVKLSISDLLKDGPKSVKSLAEAADVNPKALGRLLRALASIGIFNEKEADIFKLTPLAEVLLSDSPMSLRPYVLLLGDPSWWNSWGNLFHSVQTGDAALDHIFKMGYSDYLEQHPELARTFDLCMSSLAQAHIPAILQSYDFSGFEKIVDVGGNRGELLSAILQQNSALRGTLFDVPHVINSLHDSELQKNDRCEMVGGDFFENVPEGGDVYLLKQIIHDWPDETCIQILKNCHRAMADGGRVLIIDTVLQPGAGQSVEKFFDLHMLVTAPGGRERTEDEFRFLIKEARFEVTQIIPTPSSYGIIEGIRR